MKNKISSKIIISLVTTMMTASVMLSGCSTKKTVETLKTNISDLSAVGTFPIVKNKITLKVVAAQVPVISDIKTNEFTKWWEEKSNIHIEWQMIPSDALTEKVNLIIASGDLPDAFYGAGISDVQEAKYGVGEKLLIPLNDLIKTQAPNFTKLSDQYDVIKGAITNTDGKIYAMPAWNDCFHCSYQNKMWINQTWLDRLNLKQPTTTDEFYNVLKAFKTKDPNGNGKADEVPLAGSIDGWNGEVTSFIMNAFIFDGGMYEKTKRYVKDNKVDTSANKPEYKEGLKYLAKLYKEGLIGKASFTQKNDQVMQLAANPDGNLLGSTPNGASVAFVQVSNQKVYRQYQAIAPLTGPAGVKQTPFFKYAAVGGGAFAITKNCKNPEAALRMYDMIYDQETSWRHGCGVKDKEWRLAKPGEVGINGKPALWKMLVPYNNTDPQNNSHMWLGGDIATSDQRLGMEMGTKIDPYTSEGMERMLYDASKNNYEPHASKDYSVVPPIKLLDAESQELSTIGVELEKFISESKIKFIVGEQDIDANWDKYVKNLDSIGLKRYLEVYQTGYDRQYKAK